MDITRSQAKLILANIDVLKAFSKGKPIERFSYSYENESLYTKMIENKDCYNFDFIHENYRLPKEEFKRK